MLFARFSPLFASAASVAFAAAILAGCSTSSGSPGSPIDAGTSDSVVSCQNDSRVDQYVANLAKASSDGALKVTLVSSDPAPPAVGTNTWTIKVTDGTGAPMSNAPIKLDPFMPDHGHGTSVEAGIAAQPDGAYTITNLYLFMPGVWRLTFSLPGAPDAGPGPSVQFFFCVSG